jgi:hypothetical protein
MGEGHDHLKLLQDALTKFENAVVEREKHKLLESKISRRQSVTHAREKIVELVVQMVTDEKMKHQ